MKNTRLSQDQKEVLIFIGGIVAFIVVCSFLFGCTMQKPISQSVVNNYTITDNSQHIIGDGNTPSLSASTSTDQTATPQVSADAKSTPSNTWKYWVAISAIAAVILGYLSYKKWGKWWNNIF